MRLQILSDLHLETERFDPEPAPGAECLVLAGDIDATWQGYARFANWPVPVVAVPGNHEFDGREFRAAGRAWSEHVRQLGLLPLMRQTLELTGTDGRLVRFVGATRWSDFDLFGASGRVRAQRAARYFLNLMAATRGEVPMDAAGLREEGLLCRAYLAQALAAQGPASDAAEPPTPATRITTVVVTHFAPSVRSADPRYGAQQATTASFCNADDDLLPAADLWIHGHLHCRHDWRPVEAPQVRVVSQARGLEHKGETLGFDPSKLFEV